MIIPIILELRKRRVPVGTQEMAALAKALSLGLHDNSFDEFYSVARCILIHNEAYLDDFDQVFSFLFQGVPYQSHKITQDLLDWLQSPKDRPHLTEEEKNLIQELDLEELKRLFEERIKEQTERHDGGSYWIGTGGTSPFGTGGFHPSGMSLRTGPTRGSGGRSTLKSADARRYRAYRNDLTLDTRQIEVALRKLRSFDRQGALTELDLEKTIDETARNFGDLEVVLRKPRRPNTRVILAMDVGGSMDPFAQLISQLFSAAKRATHWKELRTYYFHNCVYRDLYKTEGLLDPVSISDLFRECDDRYRLILVGDAAMASYELLGGEDSIHPEKSSSGLSWLVKLRKHFTQSIWLNPDPIHTWEGGTAEIISQVFPMYPLTLQGLEEGLKFLNRRTL